VVSDGFVHDPEELPGFSVTHTSSPRLNHPHIAAIYGLEEVNDTCDAAASA